MQNRHLFITLLLMFASIACSQQVSMGSQENHPRIYGNDASKDDFKKAVHKTEWKAEIIEQKKQKLEKYLALCASNPDWLRSRLQMNWNTKHNKVFLHGGKFSHSEGQAPVPTVRFSGTRDWATDYRALPLEEIEPFLDDPRGLHLRNKKTKELEWVHPSLAGFAVEGTNRGIMSLVEDAAFLYWFTGEKKYADFAAPVYDTYMQGMYYRDAPIDLDNSNQQRISGLSTFEVIHEQIVVSLTVGYDFLHDYLIEEGYDLAISAAVFQKWGDQIIKNGIPDNNWNFFQARFLTYIALALDDDSAYENAKGQQYYLDHTFKKSTDRQLALKEAILNYDQKNGIWPESASYSMHVTETLLKILTLLDNATNADEFENFPIVEKATLASFQYLFPSGNIIGFGDSRHQTLPAESFEYLIANYKKYGKLEKEKRITALYSNILSEEIEKGRGSGLFELFFYVDDLLETEETSTEELVSALTSPTFYAPNASWFVQRMGTGDKATMVATFGAFGNHAHANGIAIELFANNYVLAPDMGKGPSYWHTDHRDYYSRYPAHNTVVVDGISDSEAMRVRHPFVMDNYFPQSEEKDNVFDQVTFSKVSFVEPKTRANQQRLTAVIKDKVGQAYVLDLFRSAKPEGGVQKHEYFYHNIGQSLTLYDEKDDLLTLTPSDDLKVEGNLKAYDYFSDEHSLSSAQDVKAVFKLEQKGESAHLMKAWIKGDDNTAYFSVKGPKSNALSGTTAPSGILDEKLPALVIRKNAEAWIHPFVVVFNPFVEGEDQVISDVVFSTQLGSVSAQEVTVTHSSSNSVDYIVATSSENDIFESDSLYQKGLLSITRKVEGEFDFIFTAGLTRYAANGWEICAIAEPVNASIETCDNGFEIQNDGPLLIGVPQKYNPDYVELYAGGKLLETRHGNVNRNSPDRIDFKFEKAFERAVIVLKK